MNFKGRILILVAVFLVIFGGLITFIIRPLFQNIRNDSEQLLAVRKDLASFEQKILRTSELKGKLEALEPDLESIQGLFVDPEIPVDFLQFLENMASNSGTTIDISLLSFQEKEAPIFPSLKFQLSLGGSLPACLKFLEKLETAPYLIEIENLMIRRLTIKQIETEKYQGLSEGDAIFNLSIMVFTPLEKSTIIE